MLPDIYDYFEKEKEIEQEIATEFGKTIMPLYSSLFISAYIIPNFFFFFSQKNHWSLLEGVIFLDRIFIRKVYLLTQIGSTHYRSSLLRIFLYLPFKEM